MLLTTNKLGRSLCGELLSILNKKEKWEFTVTNMVNGLLEKDFWL